METSRDETMRILTLDERVERLGLELTRGPVDQYYDTREYVLFDKATARVEFVGDVVGCICFVDGAEFAIRKLESHIDNVICIKHETETIPQAFDKAFVRANQIW